MMAIGHEIRTVTSQTATIFGRDNFVRFVASFERLTDAKVPGNRILLIETIKNTKVTIRYFKFHRPVQTDHHHVHYTGGAQKHVRIHVQHGHSFQIC